MRKHLRVWLAAALALAAFVPARATVLNGTVNNPDGSPFNGVVYFTLSNSTTISSANGCPGPIFVPNTYRVPIQVSNGQFQGGVSLYDSECMTPPGLAYNVELVSSTGAISYQQWVITGSTENVGTIVPVSQGGFVPQYVSQIVCDNTMTCTSSTNNGSGVLTLHAIGGGGTGTSGGASFPSTGTGFLYFLSSSTSRAATSADAVALLNTSPSTLLSPSLLPLATTSAAGVVECDGTTTKCSTTGVISAVGNTGPQGPAGATGPAGSAATVAIGTVSTGAAGSSASVTNTGSSSAAVFNFVIPQGLQGATGSTGPAGATGPAGPNALSTSTTTTISGLLGGNGTNVIQATVSQVTALLGTLSGCTTSGYVFSPAANGCVAQTGGGSGSVSGGTTGYLPIFGSSASISGNSHMDDGVTAPSTLTASEPIQVTGGTPGITAPTVTGTTDVQTPITMGSDSVSFVGDAGVGTSPSIACTSGHTCTASSGSVSVTVGSSPTVGVGFVSVTFGALPRAPSCVAGSGNAATEALQPYITQETTTSFVIFLAGTQTAGQGVVIRYVCSA